MINDILRKIEELRIEFPNKTDKELSDILLEREVKKNRMESNAYITKFVRDIMDKKKS